MKVLLLNLVIASVLVSKHFAYPAVKTWTFRELKMVIEKDNQLNPNKEDKVPLMIAYEKMISALFTGVPEYAFALVLSPSGKRKWTKLELEKSLRDEDIDIYITPYITQAYVALNDMKTERWETEVPILALDISTWTKRDINKALKDHNLNPEVKIYLQEAQEDQVRNHIYENKGKKLVKNPKMKIITPVGLIPQEGVIPRIVSKISS